tara:strand:+ start:1129 stop:1251 length:123 start_codon:yes stop_codon:yes gene_type:complete
LLQERITSENYIGFLSEFWKGKEEERRREEKRGEEKRRVE